MTRAAVGFPWKSHRTMAQVMAHERAAEIYAERRWDGRSTPGKRACIANEPIDYGSPFMVRT